MNLFTNILLVLAGARSPAFEKAADLAGKNKARLRVMNVLDEGIRADILPALVTERAVDVLEREAHAQHRERLKGLLKDCDLKGVDHEVHQIKGNAGDVIPELARKFRPGLIVMGTVARAGVPGLFIGNTAEAILGKVNSSVLALKPEGFETPVSAA